MEMVDIIKQVLSDYHLRESGMSDEDFIIMEAGKLSNTSLSVTGSNHKGMTIIETEKTKSRPDCVERVCVYMEQLIGTTFASIEAEKFWDHFSSNGWKIGGKAPMKDWKAAVRTWCRNVKAEAKERQINNGTKMSDIQKQDIELRLFDESNQP